VVKHELPTIAVRRFDIVEWLYFLCTPLGMVDAVETTRLDWFEVFEGVPE
jgi:hypothetical protein